MGLLENECRYCKSKEHASEDCPHGMFESKCRYCGSVNHASEDCPQGVFESKCRYCGSIEHSGENCPQGVLESKCRYCGSKEHASEDCPHGMFESKCRYCGSVNHASEHCPQGAFGNSTSTRRQNSTDSSSSDDNSGASIIGWLIGVGIIVFVVVWLAVNIVLPIALLNSALALTILALIKKDRKSMFAVLALVGGGYMFIDIMNGWLSTNFVKNVVKDKSWVSAFAYINSAALGLSTWFLVSPLWEKAKLLATTEKQKRITLMGASIILVVIATVSIPVLYNTIQNPFSQNESRTTNTNTNQVVPRQEPTVSNSSTSNSSVSNNSATIETTTSNSVIQGIYPQSSQRLLSSSDLTGLSKQDLKIMRNEIFARHGYIFKTPEMKLYFAQQSWYHEQYDDVTSQLTSIEQQNVALIKKHE